MMHGFMRAHPAALAVALLLASGIPGGGPGDLEAQIRRGPPAGRVEMQREIQRRFQERVRRELGLTDRQAQDLGQVVAAFQDERQALVQREVRLRQELRGTGALLSDEAARAVLVEMAALQTEEAELLRREQASLLEVLSPPQVVRFYTLRQELAERIRRLQGGGPGGPGGGGSGPAVPGTLSPGRGFD